MLTLLSGHPTSGITTLALDIIAQAQKNSEVTIYIEVERTLDPEYVTRRGIDLNRLLVICPQSREVGFEMARDIMLGGGAGVIVCDLGGSPANPPISNKALRRLTAGLSRVPYAVICLSTDLHGAAASQAGVHLQVERLRWLQRVERVAGYEVQATLLKNKSAPPGQTVTLPILLDKRKRDL
jgi:recombination protein RecA